MSVGVLPHGRSQPLKVLHVVTQLELGGAQGSTLQLLARLDRRKFSPSLLSSEGLLTPSARNIPGLSVTLWPSLRRTINPPADGLTFARLVSFIRRGGYHIVHTHSSKAGILGRWAAHAAQTPVIVHTVHGFGFHAFQPAWRRRFYQQLEQLTSRITDGLIVVSEHDRALAMRVGIGSPGRHRLIRYGIDAERFGSNGTGPSMRRALGLEPHRPVIGTVACLKPQKGPLDFVHACHAITRDIPEAQFVLVGDGGLRPTVERLRHRLGLDDALHLFGWRHDIPQVLAAMDVFVLASRWEGLPMACLEAMASGLPVVATTAGGIPEVIAHEQNGLLVPIAQPERLAEAVVRLLKDAQGRHRMGQFNRQSLDGRFTVERMVTDTERLYEELVEQKGEARWEQAF